MIKYAIRASVLAGALLSGLPSFAGGLQPAQNDSATVAAAAAKRGDNTAGDDIRPGKARAVTEKAAPVPFKDRLAFSTNIVNWAAMLPNLRAEITLTNPGYKPAWTLAVQAQWNGSTAVKPGRDYQYRFNDFRAEVRRYTRPSTVIVGDGEDRKQRNPKFWRAYYLGVYAEYGKYNVIFTKGAAGSLVSAGLSGGWQIPLYAGKNGGGVDLDLGLSVGAAALKFDKYHQENGNLALNRSYTKYKDYKILPYPVVSEIRVGFVYRFNSVRNQFKKTHFKAK